MATLHEQSSDIYVRGEPQRLAKRAPEIFQDYAISRDTIISIMSSIETLLADPTFRQSVRETLGGVTFIDIKVRGEDGTVLIQNPAPFEDYQEVDFHAKAAVQESLKKV